MILFISYEEKCMQSIRRELENARKKLLDLTMRNRLLNHRLSRTTSLEFINNDLDTLYDTLINDERPIRFQTVDEGGPEEEYRSRNGVTLRIRIEDQTLRTRIRSIRRKAQTFIEEQGYNVLFLALGTLEWYERAGSEARSAPLILIPVEVKRTPVQEIYTVVWSGEDASENISLAAKLQEQHIEVPNFEFDNGNVKVSEYLRRVEAVISNNQDWKVHRTVHLDFFSFTKLVMYRDLDPDNWLDGDNKLVVSLFNPQTANPSATPFDGNNVDTLPARELYNVLDADPSQIAAIMAVKSGHNLVVEGPPGTGKSQTIANIIAELLAADKKVLFVCEKMAALEVVKSRLDTIGLGDYCIEVHSRKANKREFISEIERTLRLGAPQEVDLEDKFDELDQLKRELNDYARALGTPVGEIGETPFKLIGQRERMRDHFDEVGRDIPFISIENAELCTRRELAEADHALSDLVLRIGDVIPVHRNPWRDCAIEHPMRELDTHEFLGDIARIRRLLAEIDKEILTLVLRERRTSNSYFRNLRAWWHSRRNADIEWQTLRMRFCDSVFNASATFLMNEYGSLSKFPLRIFSRRYLRLRVMFAEWIDSINARTFEISNIRERINFLLGLPDDLIAELDSEPIPLKTFRAKLDLWEENIDSLIHWAQYVRIRERCRETIAKPVIELLENGELHPDDAIEAFRGRFSDHLLRVAFRQMPSLDNFIADLHETRIRQFSQLDERLINANRQRLARELHDRRPAILSNPSSNSESGILLNQFNRKRGHMPIRTLMKRAGNLVLKIKPCFMMSPLSIAQFLDSDVARFDVVIFDEASQVRPEDALGAIARGDQAVVMGDTKQLPPTSFFDTLMESDTPDNEDEYEMNSLIATESILHQCRKSFMQQMLTWHYRSKHESLIAVSNREYYDNRLLIYPSIFDDRDRYGLTMVHLPDTVYDRGRSARNVAEARAIAQHVFEHFERNPEKSLGVGTFSVAQRDAIYDQIELLRPDYPHIGQYFESEDAEKFFVKNLETIQGDERDVIFVSVGYGFDENRRITKNFGPLTREGGERRLNVLMTRARERCVIHANFTADDLPADDGYNRGLMGLRAFLKYAETGVFAEPEVSLGDTESPFEDSVREFLIANGYEVRTQIGCAGYRIDLAVVHPKSPGRYAIGIECDGATYHSSRVARERDRLRDTILQNYRGWRLHRVWSTDWLNNRAQASERLLEAVRLAIEAPIVDEQPPKQETPIKESVTQSVEREERKDQGTALEDRITPYKVCENIQLVRRWDIQFHEYPSSKLAEAIHSVVEVEGPVHVEEVTKRIREFVGVKRSGVRIRNAIQGGARNAERKGLIKIRDDFFWPVNREVKLPRQRNGSIASTRIEHICDEEIIAAAKLVIQLQGYTPVHEMAVQVGKVFGIQRIPNITRERIVSVISELEQS